MWLEKKVQTPPIFRYLATLRLRTNICIDLHWLNKEVQSKYYAAVLPLHMFVQFSSTTRNVCKPFSGRSTNAAFDHFGKLHTHYVSCPTRRCQEFFMAPEASMRNGIPTEILSPCQTPEREVCSYRSEQSNLHCMQFVFIGASEASKSHHQLNTQTSDIRRGARWRRYIGWDFHQFVNEIKATASHIGGIGHEVMGVSIASQALQAQNIIIQRRADGYQ